MESLAHLKLREAATELEEAPISHTTRPINTGTSVLAIKYADGVMMAADTLASYGSLLRFGDMRRIKQVGKSTVIGFGGEMSDFQFISDRLDEMTTRETCLDDGRSLAAGEVYAYLGRLLYERRNKFKPLWNSIVVAGVQDGAPFVGTIDKIGTTYTDDFVATGFGNHFAIPIIRKRWRADMTEAEARALLEDCLRVLFYRDCQAINRIQLSKVTAEGSVVSEPYLIEGKWDFKAFIDSKAGSETGGSW